MPSWARAPASRCLLLSPLAPPQSGLRTNAPAGVRPAGLSVLLDSQRQGASQSLTPLLATKHQWWQGRAEPAAEPRKFHSSVG